MPYMMSYIKKGSDVYSELNDAMHLALSRDGKNFQPLRHNTGILFAEADFTDGGLAGKTKCLQNHGFSVIRIRHGEFWQSGETGEISRTIEKSDILWFISGKHRQNMF